MSENKIDLKTPAIRKLPIRTMSYSNDICLVLKEKKEVKLHSRHNVIGLIKYENVTEEAFILVFTDKNDNVVAEINKHYIEYYDEVNNSLVFSKTV